MSYFLLLPVKSGAIRAVTAWDIGSFLYLAATFIMFARMLDRDISANAKAYEEGEWTMFTLILLGAG